MKKRISIICIILMMVTIIKIPQIKVQAVEEGYVEVVLEKGSTLIVPYGVGGVIKTDATETRTYSLYSRDEDYAFINLNTSRKEITGTSEKLICNESDVKFYVQQSILDDIIILKTPMYKKITVKPGEFYNVRMKGEDFASSIVLSVDEENPKKHVRNLDYINYDNEGRVRDYSKVLGNIVSHSEKIEKGGAISIGNSGTKPKVAIIPTINLKYMSMYIGSMWYEYELKQGEVLSFVYDKYDDNKYSARVLKPEKDISGDYQIESIAFDREQNVSSIGLLRSVTRGYSVKVKNPGTEPIKVYSPSDYMENIVIKKSTEELVNKTIVSKGQTATYNEINPKNSVVSIANLYKSGIYDYNYDYIKYLQDGKIEYADYKSYSANVIKVKGKFQVQNKITDQIVLITPYDKSQKIKITNEELFTTMDILPDRKYKIDGKDVQNLCFETEFVCVDKDIKTERYDSNYKYMGITYSRVIWNEQVSSNMKYLLSHNDTIPLKLYVPVACREFITKSEDVDFNGVVDVVDLADVSKYYNQRIYDRKLEFTYNLAGENTFLIDIYDIVKVATAIE